MALQLYHETVIGICISICYLAFLYLVFVFGIGICFGILHLYSVEKVDGSETNLWGCSCIKRLLLAFDPVFGTWQWYLLLVLGIGIGICFAILYWYSVAKVDGRETNMWGCSCF